MPKKQSILLHYIQSLAKQARQIIAFPKYNNLKRSCALFWGLAIVLSAHYVLIEPAISKESLDLIYFNHLTKTNLIKTLITQNYISSDALQLLQQGKLLYQAEKFSDALRVWQEAETAFADKKDVLNQALTLNFISLTYQKLGDWENAKRAISSSINLLQTVRNAGREKAQIIAIALNTQGRLQLSLGQPEDALISLQQAIAAYTQAGDEAGITGSTINFAQTLQTLGFSRRASKTLEDLEKRLQNQPDSPIKSTGLLTLANALRISGDLDKSLEICQQSLAIAQRLQSPPDIGIALLNLGNIERSLAKRLEDFAADSEDREEVDRKIKLALEYYRQAANISNHGTTRLQANLNQMSLLVDSKQRSEAQVLQSQIQSEITQLPPSQIAIYARINLAQSLMKPGLATGEQAITNYQDIAKLLAKASQEAKSLGDKRSESFALGNLGELYEQAKQFDLAQQLTQQALLLAQATNAQDIAYRWQWQLGRLLKAEGQTQEAITAYSEAVITLQSLRSDLATINPDVQFSFRDSVEPVYRQLFDLLLQPPPVSPPVHEGGEKGGVSQKNLVQARNVIESLQLAELDNFFREACLDAIPELIDKIDRTAAVIYPVILDDRIEVILSLPQQPLRNYTTQIEQKQVESTLNQLRQALGIRHSNQEERLRLSQQVYDWLIGPIETELKTSGVQTLVFVLDGSLRNIPMAALYNGNQYLVEQYSIALTPGLQLLKRQPLTRGKLRALAGGLSESRQGFSALPGVKAELALVNAEVLNTTRLLNQEFTSTNLENEVKAVPFPVVHLATHGQFSSNFQNTFILAWDGPINVKQLDELLRSKNPRIPRPLELLVLSACETATGDKRAALGLAGVAVRAGASSTLATLWRVSDSSTAALMTEFYQKLANPGISKAEALRRAQISLLQNRNFRNPYFWAPYVLVGNWL
ncbi:CHAT domain-containing protein [Argonema antarcticum]|uniref:CHAT domain-containing protein n=1 Tax=Argonema antarcticum TaxID=2942763 RepID=UPI002011051F|nr:CHAT domain-containing protein [Argonema antarcticum]MCL1475783.1 CHAT domain-containing protein [Argonema antarcticum A004/B2]